MERHATATPILPTARNGMIDDPRTDRQDEAAPVRPPEP